MPRGSYRLGPFTKTIGAMPEADGAFTPNGCHHSGKGRAHRPQGIGKPNAL